MGEQQTTDTTQAVEHEEVSDADLIAAAQAVGGAASINVEAEEAAAAARLADAAAPKPNAPPAGAAPADGAGEPAEPAIAGIIRAREKAYAERQGAEDYAVQRRQRAEQEAAQVLADARAKAAADYDAEMAARRAKFRESPTTAIRELGFKTDDIVDEVTREGTPEWKAMRQMQRELAETQAKAGDVDKVKADFAAFKNQVEQQQAQQQRVAIEQQFLQIHASPEKAPTLHQIARSIPNVPGAVRGEAAVVAWGHALAAQWHAAGVPFAHSDVAEYLEHQARTGQLGSSVSTPPPQVSGTSGAPKVRANGSRTLSAANGSERRASPKPIEEMSPEEERQALIEAAAEARRTNGL